MVRKVYVKTAVFIALLIVIVCSPGIAPVQGKGPAAAPAFAGFSDVRRTLHFRPRGAVREQSPGIRLEERSTGLAPEQTKPPLQTMERGWG
jgi:hypothetical protein